MTRLLERAASSFQRLVYAVLNSGNRTNLGAPHPQSTQTVEPVNAEKHDYHQRLNLARRLIDDLDGVSVIDISLKFPLLSGGVVLAAVSGKPPHVDNYEIVAAETEGDEGNIELRFYPALTEGGIVAGYLTPIAIEKENTND